MKKKIWITLILLIVITSVTIFFLNNRTLDDILNSKHHYSNPKVNPQELESITYSELEKVKENGKVNLEKKHTFEIVNGSGFSYEFLEDKGKYLVLKIVLKNNYTADTDQFIVPSEIIRQHGDVKFAEPFQFQVFDSNRENVLIKTNEVGFGEYKILIDKEKAFKSKRLDIFVANYKVLVVN